MPEASEKKKAPATDVCGTLRSGRRICLDWVIDGEKSARLDDEARAVGARTGRRVTAANARERARASCDQSITCGSVGKRWR